MGGKALEIEHRLKQYDPKKFTPEIEESDLTAWRRITNRTLNEEQKKIVTEPEKIYPAQKNVLAVHWHPEHIPMELIRTRIETQFPNMRDSLIIPTQHNVPLSYDDFTGVEIDCYAKGFHRKVQFLLHFESSRLDTAKADVFRGILDHTFTYRTGQLNDFIATLLEPSLELRLQRAAKKTGADENLIEFTRVYTRKLKQMIDMHIADMPRDALRNKLIREYFNALRSRYTNDFIDRAQVFLRTVKKIVKREFTLEYFFEAGEVIEEVRALGGGIIIPHPEQFWPVLLAGYDVDGYEVWNPQSSEYTDFLIDVVHRHNSMPHRKDRPLLICMGDDCHMGEKVKDKDMQTPEKAAREIGVQPAWEDLGIQKQLVVANVDRAGAIRDYRDRLRG